MLRDSVAGKFETASCPKLLARIKRLNCLARPSKAFPKRDANGFECSAMAREEAWL